jgi:hypothetical protein
MADTGTLDRVRQRTAELVSQRLRSDAVVIARLIDLIHEAVALGHSHRSIHEAITSGGLATSWTNYRISLGRVRKARRAERPTEPLSANPLPRTEPFAPMKEMPGREATSSTIEVVEALRRARQTARKDYARIAREKLREDRREQSRGQTLQPLRSPLAKDSS